MDKIRIGIANRGAGTAPVFATIEGGYFAAEGIAPELVQFPDHGRSLAGLIAGETDFANAVGGELLLANHRYDGDAVILASAISRSAQQVSARPGYTSREQLRGRRWGVMARNDADECSIAMAFERWGWDLARDAEIVVVGDGRPRLDALLDPDKVDAVIMHAPEPYQAASRGWTCIEDLGRLDVAFQNSCAASTRHLLAARPDLVKRYVRAYCAGVFRFRTDAEFGLSVLHKYTGDSDAASIGRSWSLFARLMGGMMYPSLEGMRTAATVLHRLGALPAPVAPASACDMSSVAAIEADGFFLRLMGVEPRRQGEAA